MQASTFTWIYDRVVDMGTIWDPERKELRFELYLLECPYPVTFTLFVDVGRVWEKNCFGAISEYGFQVIDFIWMWFKNWVWKFAFLSSDKVDVQGILE